jgi:hypothetical protein
MAWNAIKGSQTRMARAFANYSSLYHWNYHIYDMETQDNLFLLSTFCIKLNLADVAQ